MRATQAAGPRDRGAQSAAGADVTGGPVPEAEAEGAATPEARALQVGTAPHVAGGPQDRGAGAGRRAAPDAVDLWAEAEGAPAPTARVGDAEDVAAGALLLACSAEAARLAAELALVDAGVAAALAGPAVRLPSGETGRQASAPAAPSAPALAVVLQRVDLLRQETAGLAQVLALLARHGHCEGRIPAACLAAATPLAAQGMRLQTPPRA